jgi:hypothetical protein
MNTRYSILLLISGACWFVVAGICGYAIPVFDGMWLQHFAFAVLASFVVGMAYRGPLFRWSGWRWYVLPLLTLLTGTTLFGFLLACSWAMSQSLDWEGFYELLLIIVFYSMTSFLVVLYPLALLTQHLLRHGMKTGNAAPGAK